ncbi:MAG: aminoacyl-tRNA hydrolase, partial [Eubacteriales bacterium]|nr:aminoacyl-tRNA hydrolase [Eubacteriales bacterium]
MEYEKKPRAADPAQGLTEQEAAQREAQGRVNRQPPHNTKTVGRIILDNLMTPFNLLMAGIACCLLLVQSYGNMLFLGVVVTNLLIGTVQELRAKHTVERLSILTAPKITVVRSGVERELPCEALVEGDVICLSPGMQVPADSVMRTGVVEADESLLTGESDAIRKNSGDMLLSGSFLLSGSGRAEVVHVGAENYAAKLAAEAKGYQRPDCGLMRELSGIIKTVGGFVVPLGALLFLRTYFLLQSPVKHAVEQTAAAMIGMIPAGLMLLTSVSLMAGVIALSRKRTLTQNMYSIETLSRVDVLCLDKTGTLTSGSMEVCGTAYPENAPEGERLLNVYVGAMANDNMTAAALKAYFSEARGDEPEETLPFSSARKFSAASFSEEGVLYLGAPTYLMDALPQALTREMERYMQAGARVLLLAQDKTAKTITETPKEKTLVPVALVALTDKLRPDAAETLRFFREQDVTVKLISGDDPRTVSSIAKRLELPGWERYIDASTLIGDEAVTEAVGQYTIFGRVSPQQKKLLVQALKKAGHTVGMTGDGVNDVLALKEADCSVAMAAGSDAAKQVSQLVLLDSDFASLPSVVMEGRRVINNITRTASLFLVKTIFSFLLTICCAVIGLRYPFQPIQLTLISGLMVGFPSFVLALEPNRTRITGEFIKNVILRAVPGGFTVFLYVLIVSLACPALGYSHQQVSTLCVYLAGFSSFMVLLRVSLPLNGKRGALLVLVGTAFLLACEILPALLGLADFTARMLWFFLPMAAVCWPFHYGLTILTARLLHMDPKQGMIRTKEAPMVIIAGLGNPGVAYECSRHNAGFLALDAVAKKYGIAVNKRAHKGLVGEGRINNERVMLVKPQTYMNLSGECIQSVLAYYKLPPERLIVLYDDVDLPVGELRVRAQGSAGTHNGMRSIIASLGGEESF